MFTDEFQYIFFLFFVSDGRRMMQEKADLQLENARDTVKHSGGNSIGCKGAPSVLLNTVKQRFAALEIGLPVKLTTRKTVYGPVMVFLIHTLCLKI